MRFRRTFVNTVLAPRQEHRILGLMLLTLHLAIWVDLGGALSRSLMLAHLGLFLLWQPVWRREQQLDAHSGLLFFAGTAVFLIWLDWELLSVWVILLTGMIGGRVTAGRSNRFAYLLSLVFLVCELLLGCLPRSFDIVPLAREARSLFVYGMFAVPLVLFLIPRPDTTGRSLHSVDFLYGLTTSLLVCVLSLGSLLGNALGNLPYLVAVTQTIFAIGLFLLAISWLWSPLAGFSGLGRIWERHLQNIGTPFEAWLSDLDDLSRSHTRPEAFLAAAGHKLVELPWVAGAKWSAADGSGHAGTPTQHAVHAKLQDLELSLFGRRTLGGVLYLHANLLLQVIGHFHNAKQRELESSQNAQIQAIYETGARVTHDIKNLLQSLQGLSGAIQGQQGRDPAAVQALIERQLPHITQRLQLALDKLQTPHDYSVGAQPVEGDAERWWDVLRMRNQGQAIEFVNEIETPTQIPTDLFDSVAENLLENARAKKYEDSSVTIHVRLKTDAGRISLQVEDDGPAIPEAVASRLFRGPVESRNGLGIGLYQAARQSEQLGYQLGLKANEAGLVVFELSGSSQADPVPLRADSEREHPPTTSTS